MDGKKYKMPSRAMVYPYEIRECDATDILSCLDVLGVTMVCLARCKANPMFDRILFKPAGFDQILTVCVFYNYVSHKLCKEWHLGEIVEYGAQCNANVECVFANDGLNIKTKNLIEWENENLHRLDSTVKSRFISKNSFIIDSLDVHAMQDIISLLTC